jgi:hypothetical protein
MNIAQWFHDQLQAGADGFVWGIEQIPSSRQYVQPPNGLGEWTAERHVFHMVYYEQMFALPRMLQWLGDICPVIDGTDENIAWNKNQSNVESLLANFRKVRAEQVTLLSKFEDSAWNSVRATGWGPVSLLWVVSKTYQHTAEHISDIMRIALLWDIFTTRQKNKDLG